jgi:iron complex transport system ATP-binding protein
MSLTERTMPILEVKNLFAGYENSFVLKDVSFSLEEGEFISILGRNGSGKSTLIKALQGILKNVSGEVRIGSRRLSSLKSRQIARIAAYVPQIYNFYFEFNVEETISMGRYVHQKTLEGFSSEDHQIIEEVLDLTEISHLKHKKVIHLSGGERQRVFIARALAQNTPLLFLDEPSSHLDISYQVEIYRILKRLQQTKKKTILLTEHNINLAVPYSQRLIFLKEGKVYADGPPERLITRTHIKEVFLADVDIRKNKSSGLPEISLKSEPQEKN